MDFILSRKHLIEKISQQIAEQVVQENPSSGGASAYAVYSTRSNLPATAILDTVVFVKDIDTFVVWNGASWDDTGLKIADLDTKYEAKISSKGTAFNKNFGTGSTDVAKGDHTHTELHTHNNRQTLDKLSESTDGTQLLFNGNAVSSGGQTTSSSPLPYVAEPDYLVSEKGKRPYIGSYASSLGANTTLISGTLSDAGNHSKVNSPIVIESTDTYAILTIQISGDASNKEKIIALYDKDVVTNTYLDLYNSGVLVTTVSGPSYGNESVDVSSQDVFNRFDIKFLVGGTQAEPKRVRVSGVYILGKAEIDSLTGGGGTGGDTIADSTVNGNILKNGSIEIQVYDDSALANRVTNVEDNKANSSDVYNKATVDTALAGKSDIGHNHDTAYATKSSEHTHSNKTTLDNLADDGSGKLMYKGAPVDTQSGGGSGIQSYTDATKLPSGSSGDVAILTTPAGFQQFGKGKSEFWESNGTSDYMKLPMYTFTDIELVMSFEPSTTANQTLFDDTLNYGSVNVYYDFATQKLVKGSNVSAIYIDGQRYAAADNAGLNQLALSKFVPDNKVHTYRFVVSTADAGDPFVFAKNTLTEFTQGKVYSAKIWNGTTLLADLIILNGKWVNKFSTLYPTVTGGTFQSIPYWGEVAQGIKPQAFSVYHSANVNATTTSATVPINQVYDNQCGMFDNTTYKVTFPEDGLYELHFRCLVTPTTAGQYTFTANWAGSAASTEPIIQATPGTLVPKMETAVISRRFKAGDTFWVTVAHAAGASTVSNIRLHGNKLLN